MPQLGGLELKQSGSLERNMNDYGEAAALYL